MNVHAIRTTCWTHDLKLPRTRASKLHSIYYVPRFHYLTDCKSLTPFNADRQRYKATAGNFNAPSPPKKQFSKTLSKSKDSTTSTLNRILKNRYDGTAKRLRSLPSQNLHKNTHTPHTHTQSKLQFVQHFSFSYASCWSLSLSLRLLLTLVTTTSHTAAKRNIMIGSNFCAFVSKQPQSRRADSSQHHQKFTSKKRRSRRRRRRRTTTTTTATTERDLEKQKTAPNTRSRKSEPRRRQKAQSQTGRRRKNTTKKTTMTKEWRGRPPRRKNDEEHHHDERTTKNTTTTKEWRRTPPRRKNDEEHHHDERTKKKTTTETTCFFRLIKWVNLELQLVFYFFIFYIQIWRKLTQNIQQK